ncbi:MAG: hypothetical protein SGJ11_03475 [Phycisphaerae bacterium]|nr:hypothetical protein [Phycisphaerae bacterium]
MHMKTFTLIALVAVAAPVGADDAGVAFDLSWHTVDGGGGTSSGGTFSMSGTIGQCDAGDIMIGGTFEFEGGFWAVTVEPSTCPADFDGNGQVGASDLAVLLGGWGTAVGDLDGSGVTGAPDLALMLGAWGPCPGE